MDAPIIPSVELNDGTSIPAIGFGTARTADGDAEPMVVSAIRVGYRLIDSAMRYENETDVGKAVAREVAEGTVARDQLVVTSKLPGRDHGYDEARRSIEGSLERLGDDRIDLYLIHWPLPRLDKYVDSWRALIDARADGQLGSIGVSNFPPELIQRLVDETGVVPSVNQIQLTPELPRDDWRAFHAANGIATEAWSPLGGPDGLHPETVEVFDAIADAHGVTRAQALLRWHTQQGVIPLPKSSHAGRQRDNLDVFGFDLTPEELERARALARPVDPEWDPMLHEEF